MKCLTISDKEMQKFLDELNSQLDNDDDFVFVWCEAYCNLVDFTNHHRIDYQNTLYFVANYFKQFDDELRDIVNHAIDEDRSLVHSCSLYHDISRKTYILIWN